MTDDEENSKAGSPIDFISVCVCNGSECTKRKKSMDFNGQFVPRWSYKVMDEDEVRRIGKFNGEVTMVRRRQRKTDFVRPRRRWKGSKQTSR